MTEFREQHREPWWQVVAVFGTDDVDEGDDFAYTVGLAERGLPELHVWCRPAQGEDPGHDWRFSMRDMGGLLNELAWRLIDDKVAVGDTWESQYDAGLVTVRFRLDEAVAANAIEAFQAAPALVHPVRWSLHRKALGPLLPMSPAAEREARAELAQLVDALPDLPSWSVDQDWGPRTPLVLAHLTRVMNCTAKEMVSLVNVTFALEARWLSTYPMVVARSAARDVGRSTALERLEADVRETTAAIGIGWAVEEWRAGLAWLNADGEPFPEERLKDLLTLVLCSHLTTVAVADRLPVAQVLEGMGPVSSVFCAEGVPPDKRWNAPAHVVDEVVALVRTAGARATVAAARAWADLDDDATASARGAVAVLGWRNAAGFPRFSDVLDSRVRKRVEKELSAADLPEWVLQTWLWTLTVVLSCRVSLTNEEIEPVMRAGRSAGIDLNQFVNTPLMGQSRAE